ncbi:MAG: hypothetical protein AVDCRST_MAG79-35, partial [uncultured Thermoleophilia bacterium]
AGGARARVRHRREVLRGVRRADRRGQRGGGVLREQDELEAVDPRVEAGLGEAVDDV